MRSCCFLLFRKFSVCSFSPKLAEKCWNRAGPGQNVWRREILMTSQAWPTTRRFGHGWLNWSPSRVLIIVLPPLSVTNIGHVRFLPPCLHNVRSIYTDRARCRAACVRMILLRWLCCFGFMLCCHIFMVHLNTWASVPEIAMLQAVEIIYQTWCWLRICLLLSWAPLPNGYCNRYTKTRWHEATLCIGSIDLIKFCWATFNDDWKKHFNPATESAR